MASPTVMMAALRRAALAPQQPASAVLRGVAARSFATESAPKQPQQQQRPRRNNNNKKEGGERKFAFELKDGKRGKKAARADAPASTEAQQQQQQSAKAPSQPRKKFSFAPSVKAKDKKPELEQFAKPAYWDDDFPASFDDSMKHELQKLEIFSDFTFLMDDSWQKQIHPLFDGAAVNVTVNCPLEDFDERLFVDDKKTHDVKVIMEVPLSCFHGLSKEGVELVAQLAGPRYQANKKMLKLTEDRYPTRVHNHKRLCDILRDLTQTADELSKAAAVAEN
ncbi:hypothetical protein P43SY_007088 [Pythium insidiosum]|uniref:Small ribosomal subunit protein mS35 mitochondrial conserved domain-containing protein n=1 Tax=Pythium insidiosum TaxID=114742 RepID=A0AAD5Q5L1_PYTIN|nr:hypothetical protein P43SY_007088 [Pythium insidiosum]